MFLKKTQKKISEANVELDKLVGTRTKMMLSKLKKVEQLPNLETIELLEDMSDIIDDDPENNSST